VDLAGALCLLQKTENDVDRQGQPPGAQADRDRGEMVGVRSGAGGALDLSPSVLDIDAAAVAHHVATTLRDQVFHRLHRRGVVVGLSGGIDSSVVAGLAARALGPERVIGLLMQERESSSDSAGLAVEVAAAFRLPLSSKTSPASSNPRAAIGVAMRRSVPCCLTMARGIEARSCCPT
jgi:asparagine synthetase B (glutamine-hydrolysing)